MIKKLILIGLGLTLLIGLPLTVFVLQNQTQPKSSAAPSTKFTFDVPQQAVQVGQTFDVPINVDPGGQNQVSFVKITFTYDGNKLDKAANPTIPSQYTQLEKPQVNCNDSSLCQVNFTISVGSDSTSVIKSKTAIATMHFTAKANTDPGTPTLLSFVNGQNQALSVATSDSAAENVFQSGQDAQITIGNQNNGGGGGGDNGGASDTPTPTPTSNGGGGSGGGSLSGGGGSSGTGTASGSAATCSSLTANPTSGNPPLAVTFTAVGSSTNDSLTQLSLNYGDGLVDTIASGSGIGTGNVNAQVAHTYSNNGTFTATATFTTSSGVTSNPTSCSTTITVGNGANGKIPATGPGPLIMGAGIGGAVLTIIGVFVAIGL